MNDWEEIQTLDELGEVIAAKLDHIIALLEKMAGERPAIEDDDGISVSRTMLVDQ